MDTAVFPVERDTHGRCVSDSQERAAAFKGPTCSISRNQFHLHDQNSINENTTTTDSDTNQQHEWGLTPDPTGSPALQAHQPAPCHMETFRMS